MSVEKLVLKEGSQLLIAKHVDRGCFTIAVIDGYVIKEIGIDRNQADLLRLYLMEHLRK